MTSALVLVIAAGVPPAVAAGPVAMAEPVTVLRSDFEGASTDPWFGRGTATVAVTSADAHAGAQSMSVTGRTADWHGAATNVLGSFAAGETYTISAWVKLAAPGSTTMKFTVAETPTAYTQVSDPVAVTGDAWVQLSGMYTMPETVTGAELYVEAADPNVSFLVDDALVVGAPPSNGTTVLASGFEGDSVDPWGPRGPVTLAVTDEDAYEGSRSMSVTGRTAGWNGPATDAAALFEAGVEYTLSAWARLAPGTVGTSQMHFTVDAPDAGNPFEWVGGAVDVTADAWVQVGGTYTMEDGLSSASLYLEASDIEGAPPQFLVDSVLITGPASPTVFDDDFEETLGAWGPRGDNTVELTTQAAHGGAQSALVTDRTQAWNGIGADVTSRFEAGVAYHISAWVRLAEGADPDPADLRLSIERQTGDSTTYATIATISGVSAAEWVHVEADYTMAAADSALVYLESMSTLVPFLVDDILVTRDVTSIQTDIPSLQDVLPWPIGVAIDERETVGTSAELVTKHFDQITAENYMKPESIQPSEGTFTFDAADQLVDFAVANDMRVYGHTLVWHSQTPDWFFTDSDGNALTSSPEDQEILRARMEAHITAIADHYRSTYGEFGTPGNPIVAFDVVNEAIAESEDDGLRRSPWYDVLGPDYIALAFGYASEAFNGGDSGGPVQLFLNDYNTELPAKRQAMVDVVQGLIDEGVPIDGVGHQFHVNLAQSITQMEQSIVAFADLGLLQAVTELDVVIDGLVTEDMLIQQGYYYRDLFAMLREHPELFAVTLWGPYDSRSWRAAGAPLVFDGALQAKHAYWGIVDPDELPILTRTVNVHAGDVPVDGNAIDAFEWRALPLTTITSSGAGPTGFQLRWAADHLTAYVAVADATVDDADTVDLFGGDATVVVSRDGTTDGQAVVASTDAGWTVVARIPLADLAEGTTVPFDVRITDASSGERISWNDPSQAQEDGQRLGSLTLIEPVSYVEVPQAATPPVIDGAVDSAWAEAPVVTTDVQVEGASGASADVRLLWSGGALHVLAEVTDPVLNDASSNAWEQDSVEVFVNPGNTKAGAYGPDDGQYRISYTGAQSISGEAGVQDNLTSATQVVDGGYVVEASIDLGGASGIGALVGVDLQVNDADANGARTSVRMWADPTGRSYQNTTRWGVAQLVAPVVEPDPQIHLGSWLVRAGRSLPVELSGFVPGSVVDIRLESPWMRHGGGPVLLGQVTVDDQGSATTWAVVPARTRTGPYVVAAVADELRATSRVLVLPAHSRSGWPGPWPHHRR